MSAETRLKKAEMKNLAQIEAVKSGKEITLAVLNNPMIGLVAGVVFLEYCERKGYTGPIITTSTEVALMGVTTAQALAPIVPDLVKGGQSLSGLLALAKGGVR